MTDSTEYDVQPSAESENLEVISDKDKFYIELRKFYDNRVDGTTKPEWTKERVNAVINSIEQFNTASVLKQPKTQQQYRNAKKYDVMSVGKEKLLILRRKDLNSPVVQVPSTDMYYDILLQAHISTGHGGRDKLIYNLKQQYVIPVPIMILFLNLCKICLNKKSCPKTGIVVRPIISQDFNKRGQVDLIDLQSTPSHNYKWILNYQDHLTKFCFLRPLTSKKATEVAITLLKIFLEVGAPMILQSDNGKEFTASIIKELITLWPACKIVNGRPRHPQSQVLVICSVQSLQLDGASTRRPRVTKYSKTTIAPGGSTEPATERSLMTATYRLQISGETCILLTVDALLDISYVTKLNERADANTFVPNNAAVSGVCKEGDAETLVLTFKEFALEWSFAKTPGGERWYVDNMRLTYNSSARILEHAAKQGRRVSLRTDPSVLLFPTPVGKSFHCPEETIVELAEQDANPATIHRAKLYLRQMRLQAFMYKRDGEFGPPWHCSDSARARSEAAPVAVGAALAIATAGTLVGYAIWRYLKVKKVQYDTME